MEAKVTKIGEVLVVNINGRLDIDKTAPFREACLKNLTGKKVVFNLQHLSFVGSTGIQNFFQIVRDLQTQALVRIAGMTPDFQRLWSVQQVPDVMIYDNAHIAAESFYRPVELVPVVEMPAVIEDAVVETETEDERIS